MKRLTSFKYMSSILKTLKFGFCDKEEEANLFIDSKLSFTKLLTSRKNGLIYTKFYAVYIFQVLRYGWRMKKKNNLYIFNFYNLYYSEKN